MSKEITKSRKKENALDDLFVIVNEQYERFDEGESVAWNSIGSACKKMNNALGGTIEKSQFTNKVYYLGSRRGYWMAVLDMVTGMEQQIEYAEGKPELSKIKIATNNILLYSGILDRAQDKYDDQYSLFDNISVEKRLKILSDICNKEISFSNEELQDEYMD